MADHSANDGRPSNSPEGTENKNTQFENLRTILLAPEQKEIAGLRRRIENPATRTNDVSTVVAEAIELRRKRGGNEVLNKALTPSVEEALRQSVRKDPTVLAGALFPVMGPAIRKSIAEAIRSMLESFNQALEHSFSLQGIRWRLESLRTGKSFAEIVLLHSLIYRVEQVFLIHKDTGLMLAHCVAPHVATQDPTMVSGMFSAIQAYVQDSFKASKEDSLDSLQVGDLEVWVEAGPQAILAAVIRGHAPASYRATLSNTIEEIHRDFGEALEQFNGDSAPFVAAEPRLELCLESHFQPKGSRGRGPYWALVAIGMIVVAAVIWAMIAAQYERQWRSYLKVLESQPGIVVTSVETHRNHYVVRGLRDPLAQDPKALLAGSGIDSHSVDFLWTSFYALNDEIVARRAVETLQPPIGVSLSVHDGVLIASGQATSAWIRILKDRAVLVPGVRAIDLSQLTQAEDSEIARLEGALNSTIFTFPLGVAEPEAGQESRLEETAGEIKQLIAAANALGSSPTIEIVGHTDTSGTESSNLPLSQRRAEFLMRKLAERGVDPRYLKDRGVATSQPVPAPNASDTDRFNRSVTLRVVLPNPSQRH